MSAMSDYDLVLTEDRGRALLQTRTRALISEAEQRAQERRVSLAKRFCFCSPCSDERLAQPGFVAGWLSVWGS